MDDRRGEESGMERQIGREREEQFEVARSAHGMDRILTVSYMYTSQTMVVFWPKIWSACCDPLHWQVQKGNCRLLYKIEMKKMQSRQGSTNGNEVTNNVGRHEINKKEVTESIKYKNIYKEINKYNTKSIFSN